MAEATGTTTLRAQLLMQCTRVDLRPALRDVTGADAARVAAPRTHSAHPSST